MACAHLLHAAWNTIESESSPQARREDFWIRVKLYHVLAKGWPSCCVVVKCRKARVRIPKGLAKPCVNVSLCRGLRSGRLKMIWCVIFQVLHFPAVLCQSLFFFGPTFSGLANSTPPAFQKYFFVFYYKRTFLVVMCLQYMYVIIGL